MATNTKECLSRGKEVDKGRTILLMDKYTKANGITARLRDLAYANGLTEKSTKVIGLTVKRMVKEFINGLMEDSTKALIEMTKNKDKAHIFGPMVGSM